MSKRVMHFIVLLCSSVLFSCSDCIGPDPAPPPSTGSLRGSAVTPPPSEPCFMFGNSFPTTVSAIPPQFPGDVAEDHVHTIDVTDEGHGQTSREGSIVTDPNTGQVLVSHDHVHAIGSWQVSETLGHTHTIIRLPKCPL